MDEDNLVIPGGTDQEISVPFESEVRASAAAQTVRVESGADVQVQGDDSDGVRLPGTLADYSVSAAGNQIVLERGDGTSATVSLNGSVDIGFDDGTATAGTSFDGSTVNVELGGATVDGGVDPTAVALEDAPAGEAEGQTNVDADNQVVLDGEDQTVEVPFDAEVTGTAAAETVQVPGNADVEFEGDSNDRVEFDGNLQDFQVEQSGNQLTLQQGETSVSVSLNGAVEMAFANGSTEADLDTSGDLPVANLGGVGVGEGFDPTQVALDPADAAEIGDDDGGDEETGGEGLPPLPGEDGPEVVQSGTEASDNINGNQSGTISGGGADDRFIFGQQTTEVTIDDFSAGDQLFFQGGIGEGDVAVTNNAFADGELVMTAGQVNATLTNLADGEDVVTDTGTGQTGFQGIFGEDALGFA